MVNIPVTLIIILVTVSLWYMGLWLMFSVLIATLVGWFAWAKLLDYWIRWALSKEIDRERLFKLGKIGLINFYRYKIIDENES